MGNTSDMIADFSGSGLRIFHFSIIKWEIKPGPLS
jgi:hypothetical protein